MQLQRLTGLERQKILDELAELMKQIERLLAILASERLLMQIIIDELKQIQQKYGNARRTEIIAEEGEFQIEDLIADEEVAITVSNTGYIKRTAVTNYRNQRRGGKGRIGMRNARGGLRQSPLHRVHARLRDDLFGPWPGLLAEGPPHPRRRS